MPRRPSCGTTGTTWHPTSPTSNGAPGTGRRRTRTAQQALADGRGGITTQITAQYVLGYLALGRGDWDAAATLLQEALTLGESMGELQRLSPPLWGLAEAARYRDDHRAALAPRERGYQASASVSDAAYLFPFLLTGIRAHLQLGQVSAAEDWLDRASAILTARAIPGTLPAIGHGRGLIFLAHGDIGAAQQALESARTAWRTRHRFWEGTWVLLDLAAVAARARRHTEAAQLADQARTAAAAAGASTLADAAAQFLTSLRQGRPATPWHPLSDRESEIARLIADGLTNRQIAEQLVLAPKTVSAHVTHILTLGPNLGAVELSIALHRCFDSPTEPILFDVGHQAYVHKLLTGRAAQLPTLRQTGGLSGYPNRAESPHDWIENSHASTALSYADGLAKALAVRAERRPVVAVVGDGALTGGMCWEALNNIAAADRPVIVVVNDNGRSYSPTIGGLAQHLAGLRLRPGYEKMLGRVKGALGRTPVVGSPIYDALHGVKRGIKDLVAPQGMFEDLGLKYLGPVDGHDIEALETAFGLARGFDGPVIVHCVTRKGYGYAPAENDAADQMHQSRGFDPQTGIPSATSGRSWTAAFADELVRAGELRDDVVAITAAMCEPTGLGPFGRRFPERCFDVGIAEQHAVASAAGLASGGLHPVVAVYATFLNRAFDQVLLDVALHRLPVTFVLDRAGITGEDGPSHNGVWDLATLGVVPGIRIAAPRDEPTLRAHLREALAWSAGPTVVRFPKTALVPDIAALRRTGGVDVLAEPGADDVDVLVVSVGALATDVLLACESVRQAGFTVRVVDPGWVTPVDPALVELARRARLVVTVEDGVVVGGVGSRIAQAVSAAGLSTPVRNIGVPVQFPAHGSVADVRAWAGLTIQGIGRRIVEWSVAVSPGTEPGHGVPIAPRGSATHAQRRQVTEG